MNDMNNQISEDFAKKVLKGLYKLDEPIGALDLVISKTDDLELKNSLFEIMSSLLDITLNELMVPVYQCHPSLGRASEPGPWLKGGKVD